MFRTSINTEYVQTKNIFTVVLCVPTTNIFMNLKKATVYFIYCEKYSQ